MNENKPDIGLIYYESGFENDDIMFLTRELATYGINLEAKQSGKFIINSLDAFFPFIQVVFSPEMVSAFQQGLLTNAFYDGVKILLGYIYQRYFNHPIFIIQGKKIKKELANIHFVIGHNRLVLPMDVDDKKYQYAVDKFMEYAASSLPSETTYAFYSKKDNCIVRKTDSEIIVEEYIKCQERQQKNNR